MELLPGERAVLNLIRGLFLEASQETLNLSVLRSRWPASHDAAYTGAYLGLMRKGLITAADEGRSFTVTPSGFAAMGIAN